MDETAMRDSILPVGDDRMMDISIASYGYNVKKLSYEVRSMDGSRLVADGEVCDLLVNILNVITAPINITTRIRGFIHTFFIVHLMHM